MPTANKIGSETFTQQALTLTLQPLFGKSEMHSIFYVCVQCLRADNKTTFNFHYYHLLALGSNRLEKQDCCITPLLRAGYVQPVCGNLMQPSLPMHTA